MKLKKLDIFYLAAFILTLAFVITMRCIEGFGDIVWLTDIRVIFGITGVILLTKQKWLTYPCEIVAIVLVGVVAIVQHVWLTGVVAFAVSLPMAIYAMINWKKGAKSEKPAVRKLTKKQYLVISIVGLAALAPSMFLMYYIGGNVWYLDSVLFVLTFIRLYLYANLYLDMFYIQLTDNVFAISMFAILSFQNINNVSNIVMYLILIPLNLIGLLNWKTLHKQQQGETKTDSIV